MAKIRGARNQSTGLGPVMTLKENRHVSRTKLYKKLFIISTLINICLILTTIIRG